MRIEQFLKDQNITMYALAERSGLSYSIVHDLIKGKSDIKKCAVDTALRLSRVLGISVEDLVLLCDRDYTFAWFRSEQCHLARRKGELDYLIDVIESREIDRYWRLSMYAEAMYEVGMIDYISRRNHLPRCENYNNIRQFRLDRAAYPADVRLQQELLGDAEAYSRADAGAIEEFRNFNIIEGEIFDNEVA